MSNLNDKQIGYIAGIIDGEGTICLSKCTWKDRNEVYFRPFIKIANTNLDMSTYIQKTLGVGAIVLESIKTDKWRACYTLRFSANMIRTFLPAITDTLIIKRQQALLLTDFLKFSNRSNGRNYKSLNHEKYNFYYEEIRRLNTRGVVSKESELGETSGESRGNPEPSRRITPGVCNEQVDSSKEMVCSDLMGNHKTVAEMTTAR